jgi:hypothetical protein
VAAAWIVLFSTVDVVKEFRTSRWWSLSAIVLGTVALALMTDAFL